MKKSLLVLFLCLTIAHLSQGQVPFIDWNNIKNPVYSHPGWSVKDACMAFNDGWFYLFFSAFFHDAGQERCHVVSVRTKNFRNYSEPLFILSGMEDGWIGMASPDLQKIGKEWILTFNSWGDKKDKPNQLFYSTSRDLVKWSGIKPLAKNITEGVRAIDAAIYSFTNKIYLVWKRRQEPLIAVADSINSNSWKILGRPVEEWFENGQFMNIDGRIHIFATTSTKHHFPSVSVMNGNGSSDQDWLKWEKFRIMDVPVEEFNTDEAANAASVADWRDKDGWFYILYAGRTEGISHLGRGDNKLGLARSKDLVNWDVPGNNE